MVLKVKFSQLYLNELVQNSDSGVFLEANCSKYLNVSPFQLQNLKEFLTEYFDSLVAKYDSELSGIILNHRKVKISPHFNVKEDGTNELYYVADIYVFKPKIGCVLTGVVNKKSEDHIGCLVHRVFNISIPRPENGDKESSWDGSNFSIGQDVKFKVVGIDMSEAIPYIRGELVDTGYPSVCGVTNMTGNIESPSKFEQRNGSDDDLQAENSVIEHKVCSNPVETKSEHLNLLQGKPQDECKNSQTLPSSEISSTKEKDDSNKMNTRPSMSPVKDLGLLKKLRASFEKNETNRPCGDSKHETTPESKMYQPLQNLASDDEVFNPLRNEKTSEATIRCSMSPASDSSSSKNDISLKSNNKKSISPRKDLKQCLGVSFEKNEIEDKPPNDSTVETTPVNENHKLQEHIRCPGEIFNASTNEKSQTFSTSLISPESDSKPLENDKYLQVGSISSKTTENINNLGEDEFSKMHDTSSLSPRKSLMSLKNDESPKLFHSSLITSVNKSRPLKNLRVSFAKNEMEDMSLENLNFSTIKSSEVEKHKAQNEIDETMHINNEFNVDLDKISTEEKLNRNDKFIQSKIDETIPINREFNVNSDKVSTEETLNLNDKFIQSKIDETLHINKELNVNSDKISSEETRNRDDKCIQSLNSSDRGTMKTLEESSTCSDSTEESSKKEKKSKKETSIDILMDETSQVEDIIENKEIPKIPHEHGTGEKTNTSRINHLDSDDRSLASFNNSHISNDNDSANLFDSTLGSHKKKKKSKKEKHKEIDKKDPCFIGKIEKEILNEDIANEKTKTSRINQFDSEDTNVPFNTSSVSKDDSSILFDSTEDGHKKNRKPKKEKHENLEEKDSSSSGKIDQETLHDDITSEKTNTLKINKLESGDENVNNRFVSRYDSVLLFDSSAESHKKNKKSKKEKRKEKLDSCSIDKMDLQNKMKEETVDDDIKHCTEKPFRDRSSSISEESTVAMLLKNAFTKFCGQHKKDQQVVNSKDGVIKKDILRGDTDTAKDLRHQFQGIDEEEQTEKEKKKRKNKKQEVMDSTLLFEKQVGRKESSRKYSEELDFNTKLKNVTQRKKRGNEGSHGVDRNTDILDGYIEDCQFSKQKSKKKSSYKIKLDGYTSDFEAKKHVDLATSKGDLVFLKKNHSKKSSSDDLNDSPDGLCGITESELDASKKSKSSKHRVNKGSYSFDQNAPDILDGYITDCQFSKQRTKKKSSFKTKLDGYTTDFDAKKHVGLKTSKSDLEVFLKKNHSKKSSSDDLNDSPNGLCGITESELDASKKSKSSKHRGNEDSYSFDRNAPDILDGYITDCQFSKQRTKKKSSFKTKLDGYTTDFDAKKHVGLKTSKSDLEVFLKKNHSKKSSSDDLNDSPNGLCGITESELDASKKSKSSKHRGNEGSYSFDRNAPDILDGYITDCQFSKQRTKKKSSFKTKLDGYTTDFDAKKHVDLKTSKSDLEVFLKKKYSKKKPSDDLYDPPDGLCGITESKLDASEKSKRSKHHGNKGSHSVDRNTLDILDGYITDCQFSQQKSKKKSSYKTKLDGYTTDFDAKKHVDLETSKCVLEMFLKKKPSNDPNNGLCDIESMLDDPKKVRSTNYEKGVSSFGMFVDNFGTNVASDSNDSGFVNEDKKKKNKKGKRNETLHLSLNEDVNEDKKKKKGKRNKTLHLSLNDTIISNKTLGFEKDFKTHLIDKLSSEQNEDQKIAASTDSKCILQKKKSRMKRNSDLNRKSLDSCQSLLISSREAQANKFNNQSTLYLENVAMKLGGNSRKGRKRKNTESDNVDDNSHKKRKFESEIQFEDCTVVKALSTKAKSSQSIEQSLVPDIDLHRQEDEKERKKKKKQKHRNMTESISIVPSENKFEESSNETMNDVNKFEPAQILSSSSKKKKKKRKRRHSDKQVDIQPNYCSDECEIKAGSPVGFEINNSSANIEFTSSNTEQIFRVQSSNPVENKEQKVKKRKRSKSDGGKLIIENIYDSNKKRCETFENCLDLNRDCSSTGHFENDKHKINGKRKGTDIDIKQIDKEDSNPAKKRKIRDIHAEIEGQIANEPCNDKNISLPSNQQDLNSVSRNLDESTGRKKKKKKNKRDSDRVDVRENRSEITNVILKDVQVESNSLLNSNSQLEESVRNRKKKKARVSDRSSIRSREFSNNYSDNPCVKVGHASIVDGQSDVSAEKNLQDEYCSSGKLISVQQSSKSPKSYEETIKEKKVYKKSKRKSKDKDDPKKPKFYDDDVTPCFQLPATDTREDVKKANSKRTSDTSLLFKLPSSTMSLEMANSKDKVKKTGKMLNYLSVAPPPSSLETDSKRSTVEEEGKTSKKKHKVTSKSKDKSLLKLQQNIIDNLQNRRP